MGYQVRIEVVVFDSGFNVTRKTFGMESDAGALENVNVGASVSHMVREALREALTNEAAKANESKTDDCDDCGEQAF